MKKERAILPLGKILLNEGQLDWLPRNPRTWTQTDIDKTAASILEDEDFLEERPILVVPFKKDTFISFAGNLRHEGAVAAKKVKEAPSVIYYPETDEDRETVKRRAMKDNGSFGQWDMDALANEWDDLPLGAWGVPVWDSGASGAGNNGGGGGHTDVNEDDFDAEKEEIHVRCRKGDIWQLGEHRLMCGDSIDLEQVKKLMGGGVWLICFLLIPPIMSITKEVLPISSR